MMLGSAVNQERSMQIIDTGRSGAVENMAMDAELLAALGSANEPILHLYTWESPCATYGHFIDPFAFLSATYVGSNSFQLARRPTGGGIIFHVGDFAFSLFVPSNHPQFSINTLENYETVNAMIIKAIDRFSGVISLSELLPADPVPLDEISSHFCMAKPTRYDVMIQGRKVGGGAQRRTRAGFLHQGSIHLAFPSESLLQNILLPGSCVLDAMRQHSFALLGNNVSEKQLQDARASFKKILTQEFGEGLG